MKKTTLLLVTGGVLFVAPLGFLIYSNEMTKTHKCIATFHGQNSLPCRTGASLRNGGTITPARFFMGLSILGAVIVTNTAVQHLNKNKSS